LDDDDKGILWLLDECAIRPNATESQLVDRIVSVHGHNVDQCMYLIINFLFFICISFTSSHVFASMMYYFSALTALLSLKGNSNAQYISGVFRVSCA